MDMPARGMPAGTCGCDGGGVPQAYGAFIENLLAMMLFVLIVAFFARGRAE
jgi:hypothetical protein